MKCRRAIVLEYFGEEVKASDPAYPCCDVCESSKTMSDYRCEMKAVIQAVNDLPNSGEKKVHLYVQSKCEMLIRKRGIHIFQNLCFCMTPIC